LLNAQSAKVRAAAVAAVRLMQHRTVDALVAERLLHDEQTVQNAALEAIAVREPSDTLASALAVSAEKANKPAVRLKAVRVIMQWLAKRPELMATLERVAEADRATQVRDAARAALGRHRAWSAMALPLRKDPRLAARLHG
jgi:hypothetical protein